MTPQPGQRDATDWTAIAHLRAAVAAIPHGLADAYRDAFATGRLAWASPAVFTVITYAGFYGIGILVAHPSQPPALIALAVLLGLVGLLAGIGLGWNVARRPIAIRAVDPGIVAGYGVVLLIIGLIALAAYFLAIGYIPLFQPGLEDARVVAAEEGGAPLRVLSLLTLPGSWLMVAGAIAVRSPRRTALGGLAVGIVAVAFALTGNRAQPFSLVLVALAIGILIARGPRLGRRAIAVLAIVGLLCVLGAGLFGAFRLASRGNAYGPPSPHPSKPNYPLLTGIAIRGYLRVPIQNLDYAMQAVPERIGWRLGLTYLQPLITVLPGKQTTFDADLKTALDQRFAGGGTVPGMLGEAYANFGPVGWVLVPLLIGAMVTWLYRRAVGADSPAWWALYGWVLFHTGAANLSGLSVASIFPVVALCLLGLPVLLEARRPRQAAG